MLAGTTCIIPRAISTRLCFPFLFQIPFKGGTLLNKADGIQSPPADRDNCCAYFCDRSTGFQPTHFPPPVTWWPPALLAHSQLAMPRNRSFMAGTSPAMARVGERRIPPLALTKRSLRLLPRHLGPHETGGRGRRRVPCQDFIGDGRDRPLLHGPVPVWKRTRLDAKRDGLTGLIDRIGAEMGDHPLNRRLVFVDGSRHSVFRSESRTAVADDLQ